MSIWDRFLRIFRRDKKKIGVVEKEEIVLYDPIQISFSKDIEKERETIQSYILTAAKHNFSEYEKKIFSRLIECFQLRLKGQELGDGFSITQSQYGDVDIVLPISSLIVSESLTEEIHEQLKKSIHSLLNRKVSYAGKEAWSDVSLIERPSINEKNCSLQFRLHYRVREALTAFSSGYRKQELDEVISFRSTYTQCFHELLKDTNAPVRYSIDELKAMFQLEGKYKQVKIFISRVIERAKKELDAKGPFSFTYQLEYENERKQRGRKKIIAIVFTPTFPSDQHSEKPTGNQQPETAVSESTIPSTPTEANLSVELTANRQDTEQNDSKKQRTSVRYFLEEILGIDNSGELEELTDLALSKGGSKYLTNLFRTCNRDVDITIEKLIQLKTDSLSAPVSESAEVAKHDSNMSHQF